RDGRRATGLGEAAALPPVTREDQPEVLAEIRAVAADLRGIAFDNFGAILNREPPLSNVSLAGIETAILDAGSRLARVPLYQSLASHGEPANELHTDITLPIADPERMFAGARAHRQAGFDTFKVKVGRDWRADLASLRAGAKGAPDARLRLGAQARFN